MHEESRDSYYRSWWERKFPDHVNKKYKLSAFIDKIIFEVPRSSNLLVICEEYMMQVHASEAILNTDWTKASLGCIQHFGWEA
jgi:hypothetical protein